MIDHRRLFRLVLVAALASCARKADTPPPTGLESAASVATPAPTSPYEPPPSVTGPEPVAEGVTTALPGEATPTPPLRGPSGLPLPRTTYPGANEPPVAMGGSAIGTWLIPGALLSFGIVDILRNARPAKETPSQVDAGVSD